MTNSRWDDLDPGQKDAVDREIAAEIDTEIDTEVTDAVAAAITAAGIPALVDAAATAADIPGLVDTAITAADIPGAVLAAVTADSVNEVFNDAGASGTAITVDYSDGSVQQVTLDHSGPTITLTNFPTTGTYGRLRLLLTQDGTGSRTVPTFSPAADYGTPGAPTLTVTATKTDVVDLYSTDGGTTVKAVLVVKGL